MNQRLELMGPDLNLPRYRFGDGIFANPGSRTVLPPAHTSAAIQDMDSFNIPTALARRFRSKLIDSSNYVGLANDYSLQSPKGRG